MHQANLSTAKTVIYTIIALIAFAANSVLCRLALGDKEIDPSSFTSIRLLSGSIVLFMLIQFKKNKNTILVKGSWAGSVMLFLYAATFSFAYMTLDTGTGALILFGSVQLTLILLSLLSGTRLHFSEWTGIGVAFSGFVYLMLPQVSTPSILGFILMTISGISWGFYTLIGRSSKNSLLDTAYNFFRTTPFVIVLFLINNQHFHYSLKGIILATLSGGIASALGYTLWYAALRKLTMTQAAVLQLVVPTFAVLGGVLFVSESITLRIVISASLILGGILLVLLGKYYFVQVRAENH